MTEAGKRVLLNNGLNIPNIGYGTAQVPDQVKESLDAALKAGYRHIDTAYFYKTESVIGETLKEWFDSGKLKREDVFITTKLPPIANRAGCVEKYLKRSLEALKLSYVDLYLIHHPCGFIESEELIPLDNEGSVILDTTTDIIALWKAMEKQVDAGRTKSIGLSNFNSKQIKRIVKAARIPPANLQIELNVYLQQKELVAFCNALDITVSAYSALGSKRFRHRLESRGVSTEDISEPLSDPVIQKIANKHKKTPGQILLRHIIQRGIIALVASANPERIKANVQVFDFELDDDDMYEIYLLDKGHKARLFGAHTISGFDKHPEYPFNEQY